MEVTVKLIGHLIHTVGFSEKKVEAPSSTTVEQLLALVGVKRAHASIVVRNGTSVALNEPVREGDRIVISPTYSGG